jgi:hypothetical protein
MDPILSLADQGVSPAATEAYRRYVRALRVKNLNAMLAELEAERAAEKPLPDAPIPIFRKSEPQRPYARTSHPAVRAALVRRRRRRAVVYRCQMGLLFVALTFTLLTFPSWIAVPLFAAAWILPAVAAARLDTRPSRPPYRSLSTSIHLAGRKDPAA